MSARKEYDMLFSLNAQLGGSYQSTFNKAQRELVAMQKELDVLGKMQADVSSYQKQQAAVEASRKKLETLQQQYDNIQKEISETGTFSADLQNKLLSKQQQIDKTTASIDAQNAKLIQMGNALRSAGVNTDDLAKETNRLGSQIDELKIKEEAAADKANNFGSAASQAFGAVHQAIVAAGVAKALQEIYEYFMSCADASMEFESAMTGVAKTTELSDQEFAAMSESVKEMATTIPATTTELAAIAETAGQLGIAKESLLSFTEIMAMLGTATNMTSDEAATMLAQFASITGMDPSFYLNLGSTIVGLGNNYATTERNIADMSQTIAAAGSIAGMSEADILGVAAAVTSLGITAQMGGSSMTKLISDINSSVSSGENLEKWAKAAGMEAEEFAKAWGDNAADALDMFIRGLHDAYESGEDIYSILSDLEISEIRQVTMITSLAKSGERLTDTLDTANAAWDENTALTTEAEKRYATTQSQLVLMQNAYNNLKVAVGDNYTPALQKLYEVGADVLGGMTEFIQKNPELVKAVTAFIGVLGAVVAGLAGYAIAAKLAAAASAMLTAAIPGVNVIMGIAVAVAALTAGIAAFTSATKSEEQEVAELTATSRAQYKQMTELQDEYKSVCDAMDETSYSAQMLKNRVDEATETYEANKQSAEEMAASHKEVIEEHNKLMASYEESVGGIEKEARSNENLMQKLEELMAIEGKSASTKQEILTVVEMLNEAMPELGLAYNSYADSLNLTADAIRAVVEAEIARERNSANYASLKDFISQESQLYGDLQAAIGETTAREKEYADAQAAADAKRKELGSPVGEAAGRSYAQALMPYIEAVYATESALTDATAAEQEAQNAYDQNQAKIDELTGAIAGYSEEVAESGSEIRGAIDGITEKMAELSVAYEEAYNAALDSVSGQYALWEKAAEVVATSAREINTALESQAKYWQNYNTNLESLTERSADIEGLAEMISSFADGSEGSVNAIAGMAKANDEDLAKMVKNWQTLREEQKTTADKLAELETDFSNSMDALQKELEGAIGSMNLSEEAAKSGKDTIQGFIDGAEGMTDQVQAAYKKIADAAIAAIDAQLDIHSPSRVMMEKAEMTWAGYINQTEAMEPEVAAAMANTAGSGAAATTEELQLIAFAPQLMSYLSALGGNEAIAAEHGSGGNYVVIEFAPQYDITGVGNAEELEAMLRDHDGNLRDLILDILEDNGVDVARRSFK